MGESLTELVTENNVNCQAKLVIIDKFDLLIKKYSRLLKYEDATSDMVEGLLQIISTIPKIENEGQIVNYIIKGLYHHYINLSKKQSKRLYHHEYCQEIEVESINTTLSVEMRMVIEKLPKRQQQVIFYYYVFDYKVMEIANILGISRQAVHRIRVSAIKKLKGWLE